MWCTCSSKDTTRGWIWANAYCAISLCASGSSLLSSCAKICSSCRDATKGTSSVTTATQKPKNQARKHPALRNYTTKLYMIIKQNIWCWWEFTWVAKDRENTCSTPNTRHEIQQPRTGEILSCKRLTVVNKSLRFMDTVIWQNGRQEKLVVIYLLLLVADTSSILQSAFNIARHSPKCSLNFFPLSA